MFKLIEGNFSCDEICREQPDYICAVVNSETKQIIQIFHRNYQAGLNLLRKLNK